jgi:uncharacterized repeat protein (TIGR03803 family)
MVAAITMMLAAALAAPAQTFRVLHSFKGTPDGLGPVGGLIRDPAGNLYGTTQDGGVYNAGTVFELNRSGETVLLSGAGPDGYAFPATLIRDSAGNLYGTAVYGGNYSNCPSGCGTVFKIDPSGIESVLYSFSGPTDGAYPLGSLIRDGSG